MRLLPRHRRVKPEQIMKASDFPVIKQAQLLSWFIMRPALYPVLKVFLTRKLNPIDASLDSTREESMDWCHRLAVDTPTTLK
jgi:hypothetical protein